MRIREKRKRRDGLAIMFSVKKNTEFARMKVDHKLSYFLFLLFAGALFSMLNFNKAAISSSSPARRAENN